MKAVVIFALFATLICLTNAADVGSPIRKLRQKLVQPRFVERLDPIPVDTESPGDDTAEDIPEDAVAPPEDDEIVKAKLEAEKAQAEAATAKEQAAVIQAQASNAASEKAEEQEEQLKVKNAELEEKKVEMEDQIKIAEAKAKAEEKAQEMIQKATEKAQEVIAQKEAAVEAKQSGTGCGGDANGKDCSDPEFGVPETQDEYEFLTPEQTPIDFTHLGLDKKMAVTEDVLQHAQTIVKVVDATHQAFQENHKKDCEGPICPFAGADHVYADVVA